MSRKIKKSVSILLALVMLCGVLAVAPVAVHAEELQVYENRKGGTFSFDPDTGEMKLISGSFYGESWQKWGKWDTDLEFDRSDIKSVVAEEGVKFTGSCYQMFYGFDKCTTVDLSSVDTHEVTNMGYMFQAASGIKELDLSGFDTSKVTNMAGMFRGCGMTELKINKEKFITSEVKNMYEMFMGCRMTSLDLSGFDTQNVTNMASMFYHADNLTSLDLSSFHTTSQLTDTSNMFYSCDALTSLDLSNFTISNTTNTVNMFSASYILKELTISDKFVGGIKKTMRLDAGESGNGWRIKGEPTAAKVSEYDSTYLSADITNPDYLPGEGETLTYKWIEYATVTWKNWDNNTLDTEDYKLEAPAIHPTYKNGTPTRTDTYGKAYIFAGWTDGENTYGLNDDLPYVTDDITYTALYNEIDTLYTLNYIYQGRKGGNKGGYVGDNEADDEKTYTVIAEVHPSKLDESGKPQAKILVDNAPVVNDPYKNCRWTFTDEYVEFDSENKVVTITANQPERLYRVELKNSDNSLIYTTRVKLNEYVKKNDSFITVPETDGSGIKFAYWSVVQNGKEVARCFEKRFNLRVTGDSVVTAHYGEAENLVTLSEAEISRQQFTENGTKKDLLYADFITAYMNKQGMELSTKSSSEYKTGVIIQYSPNVKVAKENAPGATLSENDKKTFAAGDLLTAADAKTIANGGTVGGKYSYLNAPIDNTKYNDKNRLNKSLVFTNTENARRLVLCAYYYVYNVKTDEIEMTSPVYFYLYDAGNAVNTES